MLPAVFDFLNGPVRDLVTQIYDAVGYLGVMLDGDRERDRPDPVRAGPAVRRFPRLGRATRSSRSPGSRGRTGWSCWPGRSGPRRRARRVRDRRVGRPAVPRALGPLRRDHRRRPRSAEAFFARYGGGQLLRPDGPGRPVPGLVRGRRRPDAARTFIVFSFLGSLPFTALLVFAGVQLGANWEIDRRRPQALRVRHRGGAGGHRRGLDLVADHQAAGRPASGATAPLLLRCVTRGTRGTSAGRTAILSPPAR